VVASVTDFVRRTSAGPGSGPVSGPISSGPVSAVFARVVAASGLATIIAETALQRACHRAGVEPRAMTTLDLQRALPDIERALGMFLPVEERAGRLAAIAAIGGGRMRSGDGGRAER